MKAFSNRGHQVTIFVIRPEKKTPRISNFVENTINVYEIHPPSFTPFRGKRGIGKYVNYFLCNFTIQKLASKIMKTDKFDFVYSYMPGIGTSYPAIKLKSKLKIKHVIDFADFHVYVRPKRLVMKSFQNADKIIVITDYLKQFLISKGINKEKIHLVPNGVDLKLFDPSKYSKNEIKKLRDSFNAKYLIIFSGALQDLNIIINSAKNVVSAYPDVKYLILGDHRDPNRSKNIWKKMVKEKGLEHFFIFTGKKPHQDIPKYLLCADICIDSFPDEPYYAAAHPVKLLEYGACEKPIVATSVSETKNLIQKDFGLLSEPGNNLDFSNNLISLLDSTDLRKKIGSKFSIYVRDNFNWDKLATDLEKSLEND